MNRNANMLKAKVVKNDEFYTRRQDVEAELSHYKRHFKGKTVFCNCDDPTWSAFFRYFVMNFDFLGLKELISTHYEPEEKPSYALRYNGKIGKLTPMQFLAGVENGSKLPRFKIPLQGNGDFSSDECVDLLKESDVVVTNPPFSLFTKFFLSLTNHKKKFLILGNVSKATNTNDIRPYFMNNQAWFGVNNGVKKFLLPQTGEIPENAKEIDGKWYASMGNVVWYTNLNHPRRTNEKIPLCESFDEGKYPKYDNYDAIDVSRISDIPMEYKGEMGVPLTFLLKHNPDQFELVGADFDLAKTRPVDNGKLDKFYLDGKRLYTRLVIKHKETA